MVCMNFFYGLCKVDLETRYCHGGTSESIEGSTSEWAGQNFSEGGFAKILVNGGSPH